MGDPDLVVTGELEGGFRVLVTIKVDNIFGNTLERCVFNKKSEVGLTSCWISWKYSNWK